MLICREDRRIEAGAESLLLARSIPPCAFLPATFSLSLSVLSLHDAKRPILFSASAVPNYERWKP